jgi:hypothetical protein
MQYDKTAKKYKANCGGGGNCVGPVFTRSCTTVGINTDDDADGVVNDSLQVSCMVQWDSLLLGGGKRSAKTEIVLTDWQR